MTHIPRIALVLGLSGVLPFVGGAGLQLLQVSGQWPVPFAGGRAVLITYGTVILSFMSGCLWGFATRAEKTDQIWAYGLSVIPALFGFFIAPLDSLVVLAAGFAGILLLDALYQNRGLAPAWWLRLRMIITPVVLICLIGATLAP